MEPSTLTVLLLVCIGLNAAASHAAAPDRRSLLQAGTARFMNAPIITADVAESGPATRPRTKHATAKTAASTTSTATQPQQPAQAQTARGLLAEASRRHERGNHWRSERWQRYRNSRYDRSVLSPWLGSNYNSYRSIQPQPFPILRGILSGLLQLGNPRGTAQSLAQAYSSGRSEAAAQAVASAAADGSSQATTMAQALTETAASHPNIAPGLLAKSAEQAVNRGQTDRYAATLADAFGYAKQQSKVPQFTTAVCDAINSGGDPARYASGQAIAKAIAQGGDSKAAVAEATATAICAGGSTAQAWSSAYAVALEKDQNGCLTLNEAKAMAQAKCGQNAAEAVANTEASSTVLGFCGLLDDGFFPDNMSWSGGNSGSSTNSFNG